MSRRIRFTDISLPVVVVALIGVLVTRRWVMAVALLCAVGALGLVVRLTRGPGRLRGTTLAPTRGQPLLVYVSSPLCTGCRAAQPIVDRAIRSLAGRLEVRRVNVLTREGQQLAGRLAVDLVPVVLLFDRAGRERYRQDALAVRRDDLQRMVTELEADTAG